MTKNSVKNENLLKDFESELCQIEEIGRKWNVSDEEIKKCLYEVFLETKVNKSDQEECFIRMMLLVVLRCLQTFISLFWLFTKIIVLLGVIYVVATSHNPTQKFIMRHSQNLIYPIMRSVRLLTLPVVRKYRSLTEWHEEECLLRNPFYQEPTLDCWPCEDIRTVVDLTGLFNYSKAYAFNEKPFLVRDVMEEAITIETLQKMYTAHPEELERGTANFMSNTPFLQHLRDLWSGSAETTEALKKDDLQILWKMNRVSAAQVMRKTFKRPYFVPSNSEVALQRLVYIDGPKAPQYSLFMTNFANVWLVQGQGYRLIVLDPSDSCHQNCSSVSVLLKPKDVLYYNWQFWHPRSLPARLTEEISITFMASFY